MPCGGNVAYMPQQSGLTETSVTISELLPHANYTFEVEAVNGVSDLSRTQRLFAAVSIATSQAGKKFLVFLEMCLMPGQFSSSTVLCCCDVSRQLAV